MTLLLELLLGLLTLLDSSYKLPIVFSAYEWEVARVVERNHLWTTDYGSKEVLSMRDIVASSHNLLRNWNPFTHFDVQF